MTENANNSNEQLTQGQEDCLFLVHQHLTSKEIGLRLGISSHTVDQRIRAALRILGCKRRTQAAKLLAQSLDQNRAFLLQRRLAEPFAEHQARWPDRQSKKSTRLPFATRGHRNNGMSIPLRLFWIIAIASGSAFSAGILFGRSRKPVSTDSVVIATRGSALLPLIAPVGWDVGHNSRLSASDSQRPQLIAEP